MKNSKPQSTQRFLLIKEKEIKPQKLTTEGTEKYSEHSEKTYTAFYIIDFLCALCGLRLISVSSLRSAYCMAVVNFCDLMVDSA